MAVQVGELSSARHGWVPEKKKEADPAGLDAHTPGAKLDAGKDDWSLLHWPTLRWVVKVATFGKNKYTRNGWMKVANGAERYEAAMFRHWTLYKEGEQFDPDSGMPHLAHFLWNAFSMCAFLIGGIGEKSTKLAAGTSLHSSVRDLLGNPDE